MHKYFGAYFLNCWFYLVLLITFCECKVDGTKKFSIDGYLKNIDHDLEPWAKVALNNEYYRESPALNDKFCSKTDRTCPPTKFSQITGHCNNVLNENWGRRGTTFSRLLPSNYFNETQPLTNLSDVSNIVQSLQRIQNLDNNLLVTSILVAWAEFLMEDISKPIQIYDKTSKCCEKQNYFQDECYSLIDKRHCIPYSRSVPSITSCGTSYKRNQMNSASSFLDASSLYGSSDKDMFEKRTYQKGSLKLPNYKECDAFQHLYGPCNPIRILFLKEHNRVAKHLSVINKHWSDEQLFWEARRIVIAQIQHITYNEFLKTLLGESNMGVNEHLILQNYGHYNNYSSSKHVEVFNEVAVGIFPALLSMYPSVKLISELSNEKNEVNIYLGLMQTLGKMPNVNFTGDLKEMESFGWTGKQAEYFIHRSRDHGLNSYIKYAQLCRGSEINHKSINFFDLNLFGISSDGINTLKSIYKNVNDIDLMIGGVLESPLPGAVVGPTFSCIIQQQFTILKQGDRFWYENDIPPSSFSLSQIQEIKKARLSAILCANVPDFKSLPINVFVTEDDYLNSQLNCDYYPLPSLSAWVEVDKMSDELTEELLMDAISKAESKVLNRQKMEYDSWKKRLGVDPKSPSGTAAAFSKANKYALRLANSSHLYEYASREIINSLENRRRRRRRQIFDNYAESSGSYLNEDFVDTLQNIDISSFVPTDTLSQKNVGDCNEVGPCDPSSKFRTYTGHCNNLQNPDWGKSLTPFTRLLPAEYDDHVAAPRIRSVSGRLLPSPRKISVLCHQDFSHLSTRNSLMLMQYAQFLDHDLTMTPIHQGFHESVPDCRSCNSSLFVHPECNPIPIPAGDPYYPQYNQSTHEPLCMPFMRSLPGQNHVGARQQLNQNTGFLDGSQIYGENQCVVHKLKRNDGTMNSTLHPGFNKDLLPRTPEHPECKTKSGYCFIAGDGRASEQAALTMIHTIFLREHNHLFDKLRRVNPHWDGDTLFQVVRKMVIAELQHITYNEFLPRLIGWDAVNQYGLQLLQIGHFNGYNPSCHPAIKNEFAAAAYRVGHSLLRPYIPRLNSSYQYIGYLLLRNTFFNPDMLMEREMIDEIARGMVSTPMESLDQFITGEVTNHLFEDKKIPFSGVDLVALNIQRGRDHGIPSYNKYRQLCNLKYANDFNDLLNEMSPYAVEQLRGIYESVDDIDLFPGGLSETPLKGGLTGPTFACIIGLQFRELKRCDRFWYENNDPVVGFTARQLTEIRKMTLAKIMCANLDTTTKIQKSAFDLPDNFLNPRLHCNELHEMDMNAWKDDSAQGCLIGNQHIPVGQSAFPNPCTSCICTTAGTQCASLRVTNCEQLMREWSLESILKDDICATQCAYHLMKAQQISNKRQPPRPLSPSKGHTNFFGRSISSQPFRHSARPFQHLDDYAPILNPIL